MPPEVREAAIRLLARREHSRRELSYKLRHRGFAEAQIEVVLDCLEQERLLSDERYAEMLVRSRSEGGYGPLRIRAELRERGIDGALIECQVAAAAVDWVGLARQVRRQRFGEAIPAEFKAKAKQMRYLQNRGFDGEQIRAAVGGYDEFE